MTARFSSTVIFYLTAGLTLLISQLVRSFMMSISTINYSLAFSISAPTVVIYSLTVIFLVIMIWLYFHYRHFGLTWSLALGGIVGGGMSNFLDRLMLSGGVADYWSLLNISTINLPDVMIFIGIILAVWQLMAHDRT